MAFQSTNALSKRNRRASSPSSDEKKKVHGLPKRDDRRERSTLYSHAMAVYSQSELEAMGFASLGKDVKLSTRASLYGVSRISIGDNSRIDDFCVLSAGEEGIEIGRYVHVSVMVSIIGKSKVTLSDFSGISGHSAVYSSSDDYSGRHMTNPTVPTDFTKVHNAPVYLGMHALVGAGSVILPGAYLEDGVAVGAQSLVLGGRLKEFGIYAGVPAKLIKPRYRDLTRLHQEMERLAHD